MSTSKVIWASWSLLFSYLKLHLLIQIRRYLSALSNSLNWISQNIWNIKSNAPFHFKLESSSNIETNMRKWNPENMKVWRRRSGSCASTFSQSVLSLLSLVGKMSNSEEFFCYEYRIGVMRGLVRFWSPWFKDATFNPSCRIYAFHIASTTFNKADCGIPRLRRWDVGRVVNLQPRDGWKSQWIS